jgi:hypothetical protein
MHAGGDGRYVQGVVSLSMLLLTDVDIRCEHVAPGCEALEDQLLELVIRVQ